MVEELIKNARLSLSSRLQLSSVQKA
jgi:hypothetical protein